ncbi:hypothetical protein BO99DRAFT_241169 [Aspergillus violaceofuscus CBS 115571]|uniref:Uncharacterized protein n=1 Tax=Aspergillus violaceofuscus (strain CBS 115571) TaxID=1450538 RepID=A0A2V5IG26_ASPV1|nr:hypothetical protein BO99DRAFT_241169 [Aspergillus violaceofuscus CBS 115571]
MAFRRGSASFSLCLGPLSVSNWEPLIVGLETAMVMDRNWLCAIPSQASTPRQAFSGSQPFSPTSVIEERTALEVPLCHMQRHE